MQLLDEGESIHTQIDADGTIIHFFGHGCDDVIFLREERKGCEEEKEERPKINVGQI